MIVRNIHNHILFSKSKYIFMTTGFFSSVFFNNFKKSLLISIIYLN